MADAPTTPAGTAWANFEASLKQCIQQAWPEVNGNQHPIYRATQAQMRPWRDMLDKKQVVPPWVVWSTTDTRQKQGMGGCNVNYMPWVTVHYCISIAATQRDDAAGYAQEKYAALEQVLRAQQYDGFQLWDGDMTPDISDNSAVNRQFIASVLPYIGATLSFRALFGYIYEGPGQAPLI